MDADYGTASWYEFYQFGGRKVVNGDPAEALHIKNAAPVLIEVRPVFPETSLTDGVKW